MPGFSPHGPWVNGSSPGLSASVFTDYDAVLQQLEGDINSVQVVGGTSGTATCYQVVQGTFKYAIIVFNNFKTAGSAQNLVLPTAFTYGFAIRSEQTPSTSFLLAAAAQSCNIITSLPASASASGGVSSGTTIGGYNQGECRHGCDTLQYAASASVATNGFHVLEGI